MKKKVLALVLCCALAVGLLPVALSTAFDNDTSVAVYANGAPVPVLHRTR